jgi:hypothetical protein
LAQYKVIQDIEAEDKLLGPLSLRQFIYAAITVALGFVAFRIFMTAIWPLGFIFVPPMVFFGLLAAPFGAQQSSEIWLLAKIRFFLKPRRRIWDQTGLKELVTITVPKKIEKQLTKGYSTDEVQSRLKALAATLDTRGWAVKNATAPVYGSSGDRLLDVGETTTQRVTTDVTSDIMDISNSPRAQAMDAMIQKSAQQHRSKVIENVQKYASNTPTTTLSNDDAVLTAQLLASKQAAQASEPHNIAPRLQNNNQPQSSKQGLPPVTATPDPAILNLVENSEGLSVKTVSSQAERIRNREASDDEVVISLH